jgi:hypothetical protein
MGFGYAQIEIKHVGGIGIAPTVHTGAGSITATVITPCPAMRSWPAMG